MSTVKHILQHIMETESDSIVNVTDLPTWCENGLYLASQARKEKRKVFSVLDLCEDASVQDSMSLLPISAEDESQLGRMVCLYHGDITSLHCDAIVNAARPSLLGGGGVDGAIHKRAGPELLEACKPLDGCLHGEAKTTDGFNLPCKHVIHTVGPHRDLHTSAECVPLLQKAYSNSIREAVRHNCRTLALSCISAGAYRMSSRSTVHVALQTVRNILADPETRRHFDRIVFVCFTKALYAMYAELLPRYFPVPSTMPGPFVCCFSMASTMIDDIQLVSGDRHDGFLGGAGPHAALGMVPWLGQEEAALVTRIGQDFPADLMAKMTTAGLCIRGVRTIEQVQSRALSIFHEVGPRSFSMNDVDVYRRFFRATVDDIPGNQAPF